MALRGSEAKPALPVLSTVEGSLSKGSNLRGSFTSVNLVTFVNTVIPVKIVRFAIIVTLVNSVIFVNPVITARSAQTDQRSQTVLFSHPLNFFRVFPLCTMLHALCFSLSVSSDPVVCAGFPD